MMVGTNNHSHATAARIKPGTVGAEIGVWKADTSVKFLARGLKELHLVDAWSLDAWFYDLSEEEQKTILAKYSGSLGTNSTPEALQDYYDKVYKDVLHKVGHRNNVVIRRMDSKLWFKEETIKFDWVYIDGDHSYEGCLHDLKACLGVLKEDGIIFGDDYGNKKGVTKAVDEFVRTNGFKFENFEKNQFQITR